MKQITKFLGPVVALGFGLGLAGCPSWWARTPEHVKDVAAILACVVEKAETGMKLVDIAITCGVENADKVLDILKTQQAIEAKHAAKLASSSLASPQPITSVIPSASASIIPSTSTSASTKPVTSTSASASAKPTTSASTSAKSK